MPPSALHESRSVGRFAMSIVVVVLVTNVVTCWTTRQASPRDQRLGARASKSLAVMASRSPDRDVRGDLAFLHYLAEHIPGTRLSFPAALTLKARVLAGFARVEAVPVEGLSLAPDVTAALAERATGTTKLGTSPVQLIEVAAETRYVLVAAGDDGWLLLPEPMYRDAGGTPLPQEPSR